MGHVSSAPYLYELSSLPSNPLPFPPDPLLHPPEPPTLQSCLHRARTRLQALHHLPGGPEETPHQVWGVY